jgi:hypothetical protein
VRRMLHMTMVLCFFFGLMNISIPAMVYACSCVEKPAVEEELQRSIAVFAGKASKIIEHKHLNGRITTSVLFEVTATWKGLSESQVIITTGLGGGDCGYDFEQGKEYLVYANPSSMYGDQDDLVTIICDRTNELRAAQEDIAVLGEGQKPTKQVNLEGDLQRISMYVWLIVTILAVVVVFFVWRRLFR